ncbi:MAG: hypothetical protein WAL61_15695 [Acidimicrobiales bacterium]
MLKAQSYLLAGPLVGAGEDVMAAGAAIAGGSGATPASKPTAATRMTAAAAFLPPHMTVTLTCRAAGRTNLHAFSYVAELP